ncbi:unnamed protein product, partial [Amoebophrya sp. A25]
QEDFSEDLGLGEVVYGEKATLLRELSMELTQEFVQRLSTTYEGNPRGFSKQLLEDLHKGKAVVLVGRGRGGEERKNVDEENLPVVETNATTSTSSSSSIINEDTGLRRFDVQFQVPSGECFLGYPVAAVFYAWHWLKDVQAEQAEESKTSSKEVDQLRVVIDQHRQDEEEEIQGAKHRAIREHVFQILQAANKVLSQDDFDLLDETG